jgi:phosphatidylglycerol:prolipoprotein diacylglycerol transferase
MHPILFKIGPVTVYSYGTLLAVALFAGLYLGRYELKRRKMNPDIAYDLILAIAIGGIVGARLFYIIGHWQYYGSHLSEVIQVQKGGLVFYGGLLVGGAAVFWVIQRQHLDMWKVADALAAPIALGTAIGRIGCLLQGCCYGLPTKLPWGINFFDIPRHPTQLYELLFDLAIFLGLFFYLEKGEILREKGSLFLSYLMIYSFGRFFLEFLRASPRILRYFTFSQLASAVLFGVTLYVLNERRKTGKL